MSFSHWLNNLRNRIQTPPKRRRRKSRRPDSAALHTALNKAAESLEDRTLLSAVFEVTPTTQDVTLSLDDSGNVQIETQSLVVFSQPLSSVDDLTIVGNDLDNTLFVDFSNGNPIPAGGLTFDGVNRGTDFDTLALTNSSVLSFTNNARNSHDGTIEIENLDGSVSTINYLNIEPINGGDTVNATFNLPGVPNPDARVAGGTTSGQIQITGSTFEGTTINNPTGSLTVNGGIMADDIRIEGVDPAFDADLTIAAGTGDTVTFQINPTNIASGQLAVTADTIDVNAELIAGSVSLSGDVDFSSNFDFEIGGTTPGSASNQHEQIDVDGSVTISRGNATFTARGGFTPAFGQSFIIIDNDGTADAITGAFDNLAEGATISNFLGSGADAKITYAGGDGNDVAVVFDYETTVTLNSGVLTITDVFGEDSNDNLTISYSGGTYTITDTGGLIIDASSIAGSTGTGTSTVTVPDTSVTGILFDVLGGDDSVTVNSVQPSLSGNFTITGGTGSDSATINGAIATTGTGAINVTVGSNIVLRSGSSLTTVNGGITLDANADGGQDADFIGIETDNATIQTTGTGDIQITGHGSETGGNTSSRHGVLLFDDTKVTSTATGSSAGTISITGTGGGGTLLNMGVRIESPGTEIASVDGNILIDGSGGAGTGNFNIGVQIAGNATVSSTGSDANAATITIIGTAGSGVTGNDGVELLGGSNSISSDAGDVTISGTGGTGTGNEQHGVQLDSSSVEVNNANISISGTATQGNSAGVLIVFTDLISMGSGSITLSADGNGGSDDLDVQGSPDIGGSDASGDIEINVDSIQLDIVATIQSTGALTIAPRTASTTIGLGGGSGTLNLTDDEIAAFSDSFSSITIGDATAGDIDINTATFTAPVTLVTGGEIHDAASGTDINAGTNSVTLDGTIAPGQSPGILVVTGNFAFAGNSTYEVEIGGTSPGTAVTDHDQIVVTGTVTIGSNVTLDLQQFNGFTPSAGDSFVIVRNDGSDAVTGTFNGLAEGATISNFFGSGLDATISYTGGNGNDVVLTATVDTEITLSGGTLTITDTNGGASDDDLTISYSGGTYTITDTGGLIIDASTITGSTGSGTSTVTVPDTGVTGILFDVLGGDDNVTVDSVQASFSGDFTITGGTGSDSATINGAIATTGTGAINVTVGSNIVLGSATLTTVNGGITLSANADGGQDADFIGIEAANTTISTTGTGSIALSGNGSETGGDSAIMFGVFLHSGTSVTSTATGATAGTITINGTGGNGTNSNHGVYLDGGGTNVTSVDGDISITGSGGDGSDDDNHGVYLFAGAVVSSTGTGADAATITINGTGGDGAGSNVGVYLQGDPFASGTLVVTSVDGDVSITGTGGDGSGGDNIGAVIEFQAIVQVTTGALTVSGTARGGGDAEGLLLSDMFGGWLQSVGSGTISVTAIGVGTDADFHAASGSIIGDATHAGAATGATGEITINADSIDWSGTLSVETDGALTIQPRTASTTIGLGGGSGTLNLDDTELGFLQDGFSSITIGDSTSGDVDIDTASFTDPVTLITGGEIHDAASGTDINAGTDSVTLDGTIAPGQSPGILVVSGNFTFADNSTFEVEIGGTSPGTAVTDHDQIDVTGTVTIGSNVTLDLQQFNGFTPSAGDSFVIVNNDAADAVTGTFNGLAEGASISSFLGSGLDATISYVGGDGNDVVVTAELNLVEVNSGDLDITTPGNDDDRLTIVIDGANYRISRVGGNLTAGNGATQDGNDVLVPLASVTGEINVTTSGGDDDLEVDFNGGIITPTINFDGGGQTSSDSLTFTAATVTSVTHSFTNANDGSVDVVIGGMTSTINYIDLEPINDNMDAIDRVFEFTGADETITLSDDGDAGDGQSFIDSDLSENVTFNNPTGSLTIEVNTNGGSGADSIFVEGLDSLFNADLTINGGDDDLVVFDTAATDIGMGSLQVSGVAVGVVFGGSIATSGGSLTFETTEEIFINGDVSSGGGNITFNADTDQAVTPDGSVVIEDAMVTSGGGNIVIGGGADPTTTPTVGTAAAPHPDGVYIHNSTLNSGVGDISILGSSANNEDGVDIGNASTLTTTTGSITIDGTGTGLDDGIDLHGGSTISTTTGDISITGTASGAMAEDGVLISGNGVGMETTISTQTGSITITGNGANADSGVELAGFVIVESTGASGAGTITINGTSADPDQGDDEAGTSILNSTVRSVSGAIDINGASTNESAVVIDFGTTIQSTGTGVDAATISLTGDASVAGDFGVVISDSTVTSVDGDIDVTGTDTQRAGVLLFGGTVSSTGITSAAATITIMGTSTGIDGVSVADSGGTGSQVTSVAGAISITGIATGATDNGVTIETNSSIASTGTGGTAADITLNGTSGSLRGISQLGAINSVDGTVNLTGDASTGTEGVFIDSTFTVTGTGSISVTGTGNAGSGTPTGIFFDNNVVTNSGTITGTALVGRIVVDVEESLESMSNNVTLMTTDTAAAGDNIEFSMLGGINALAGTITLISGDDILLPNDSFLFADSLIDLTVDAGDADTGVGGNADLIGIVSATSFTGTGGADDDTIRLAPFVSMSVPPFMIPVSGFDGMAATLTGNGGADSLRGGDSDDLIDGGVGADTLDGGAGADTLTSGAGNDMISGGAGADLFEWNHGDGNDTFDGGADADSITIGTGTVTSVTHNFVNNSDGSFDVDAETVTYTNIEPILDQLTATTRTFTFTGGAETILLTDDGDAGDGQSMIDSDLAEVVTFDNPSGSLTINAGSGSDTVNLTSLDSTFDANLTVNGDGTAMAGSASVNVNGDLNLTSGTIEIGTSGDVTQVSFNGGSLTTTANVSVQAADGIIDGDANVDVTAAGLLLSAGESVGGGTADPLETTVANLEVAAARGLTISETDNLTIGGVDAGTTGISTLSTITITAAGSIQVDENVTTDAGTGGNLTITGAVDIDAAATVSALDDSITLTANNDGDDDVTIDGTATAENELTVNASQNIIVTGTVQTTTDDVNLFSDSESNGTGGIRLTTSGDILAGRSADLQGSSLTGVVGDPIAIEIQDDGANAQITSGRATIIRSRGVALGDASIVVNGLLTGANNNSSVFIRSNGDALFGENGDLDVPNADPGFGFIGVDADVDGDGSGGITMSDGTLFNAGNSDLELNAAEDITLGGLMAGRDAEVFSTAGAIIDGGDTLTDVVAIRMALLVAETGVGTTADRIDINTAALSARTDSGDIAIESLADVSVERFTDADSGDTFVGLRILDTVGADPAGVIEIVVNGALSIPGSVINDAGGNITLTTIDTAATGEDLTIGTPLVMEPIGFPTTSITTNGGIITLNVGDDLSMDTTSMTSTTGDVVANLDNGNADAGVGTDSTVAGTITVGSLTLNGESDDDSIDASAIAAPATFNGMDGDDTLIGGSGNDSINGNAGNDVLQGNAGEELFVWNNGDGSDMIDGGAGTDELEVNGSTVTPAGDTITVSANGTRFDLTRVDGGAGLGPFTLDVGTVETLDLNTLDGDDSLTVGDLSGVTDLTTLDIDAGEGNDALDLQGLAGGPVASLVGGNGDDTVTASSGPEGGDGSADALLLNLNAGTSNLEYSVNGIDVFTAVPGAGDDQVIINGSNDDDSLTIDFVNGSPLAPGGTFFNGGAQQTGGDDLTLNNGTFTAITHNFTNANDGTIDLDDGATSIITYTGLEPIFDNLSATDRVFNFGATDDDITLADLAAGTSRISSVSSSETVDFVNPAASLTVNAGDGADTFDASGLTTIGVTANGGNGNDTLTGTSLADMLNGNANDDSILGGDANDTIMGGGGNDELFGENGDDTLTGNSGNDSMTGSLGNDAFNGGDGTDRIIETRDADFDLGDATLTISPTETDTLVDVEEADLTGGAAANTIDASDFSGTATLMGGDNDDTITGAMGASVINGNMGNDSLTGLDADDTLMGGGNDDILNGGGGVDMLSGQAGNDTLIGGTGNDTMNGGDNDDLLIWNNGDGSDLIDGGADTDELEVNGSTVTPNGDDITVSANGARFDLTRADGGAGLGPFSLDVGTIETLDLNTLDGDDNVTIDDLTGVADLASIEVEGGDGTDTIDASALPNLGLNVLLEGGNDDDTITGSAGPSAINGNMGNDSLIGGAAADTIMGGGGDDIMNGGAGGDMLTGQAGDDTMTGDTGDDTMNGGADTDLIVESGDTDFDLGDTSLVSPLTGTDVLADVEEADLTGGASANTIDASDFSGVATLTGNDGDDTMTGAQGSSMINGNMGNDSLLGLGAADGIMGGGGNDVIDGGAGNDTLTGQANDDTITGNTGDDNIMGGDGADLINGSLGNDTISGDAGDDRIQGSNQTDYPGNPLSPIPDLNTLGLTDRDSLLGGAGSDTIAGAIGADFIDGEADADIIDAQSGGDTTNGIDTIVGGAGDTIFRDPEDTVL